MRLVWGNIVNAALWSVAALATPTALADSVELANGDVLTGKVVAHTDQALTLEHALLGSIVIQADRIQAVVLEPLATQLDPDNENSRRPTHAGPADNTPANAPGVARPPAKGDAGDEPSDPAAPLTAFDRFIEEWQTQLTIGLNGSMGSTQQQSYYAKFKTTFEDERDRWDADARWYYAQTDGDQTQNQFEANLTRDWLQEESDWFFFLKGHYQYDTNRSWENRTSGFGGGGYTLAKTQEVELNTRLGFGGTYEYGSVNEFTPEALFGGSVVKWNLTERADIAGEALYYPSLEDESAFRVESALEWTYKLDLARGMSFKLGVENEYDSSTPNETGNNEFKYFGAVVFKF